jgi:hypothetical protein
MLKKNAHCVIVAVLFASTVVAPTQSYATDWRGLYKNVKTQTCQAGSYIAEKSCATYDWCGDHKKEIAAAVITTAIAIAVRRSMTNRANGPYNDLSDSDSVGPRKGFTQSQKQSIFEQNRSHNNGQIRSDLSGGILTPPRKHLKGVSPSWNEAHVDHIRPRANNGTNSFSNAQVLSRGENLFKGAK